MGYRHVEPAYGGHDAPQRVVRLTPAQLRRYRRRAGLGIAAGPQEFTGSYGMTGERTESQYSRTVRTSAERQSIRRLAPRTVPPELRARLAAINSQGA